MSVSSMVRICCLCALALLATTAAAQSDSGNMMKMTTTTRMTMPGMAAMGPMTHTMNVCTSAKKPDPSTMMRNRKDCTVSAYKQSGNTISYHMACSGQMQMSGDGRFTMLSDGNMKGEMHVQGSTGSGAMKMDMTFDGVRTGSCDYTPSKGM